MFPTRFSVCALVLVSALLAGTRPQGSDPAFRQMDAMVKTLSEISGLAQKHRVGYGRISKQQLRAFLTKRIKQTLRPDELRADELSLKLFGLVPQDFDLRKSTIDLLSEQAAAFYDYQEKKLFLLSGTVVTAEDTTTAHELAHALADQNFDLERYMQETTSNDDENLAHTAVVEGQASWLMLAYDLKQNGTTPEPTQEMLKSIADSSDTSTSDYPVLKNSPLYIQQSLLFPYTEGIMFFNAVYKRDGKQSFAEVFRNPPTDTSQIMHPERYFGDQHSEKPALPELPQDEERHELASGSMGEFDHRMLLRQYVGEAEAAQLSPHLRGGNFKIWELGKARRPMLEYVSEWDSSERAEAFFADYRKVLQGKWKHCDAATNEESEYAGTGDNGLFVTRVSGDRVTSVEGLSNAAQWTTLKEAKPDASTPAERQTQ